MDQTMTLNNPDPLAQILQKCLHRLFVTTNKRAKVVRLVKPAGVQDSAGSTATPAGGDILALPAQGRQFSFSQINKVRMLVND